MKNKIYNFMQGRYGVDQFSKFTFTATIVFLVLSLFFRNAIWDYAAILLIIYSYFRMFSKNHAKRYEENQKYLGLRNKFMNFFLVRKSHMQQRKTHHIYTCPTCKQKIRVPRGKGKIRIHCPKCNNDFIRKS